MLLAAGAFALTATAAARELRVCPAASAAAPCDYAGDDAIQQAVEAARSGDSIRIRAGTYTPRRVRDVAFQQLRIRGYVVIEGRDLALLGEPGAILDGSAGVPASALVVRGGRVTLRNLTVRGFRAADPEDDVYDGHGLFMIDAQATISDVVFERLAKMAVTLRGHGSARIDGLRIVDGHVGIWLEEQAQLRLRDAVIRNNESAGLCAYGESTARIEHALFQDNRDDGVYGEGQATIELTRSALVGNAPYGLRAAGHARIHASQVMLADNATAPTAEEAAGRVRLGAGALALGLRLR
ncbi:MAG: right-handed parallel beta-helix repeat-containing protein [Steroidobacteraceae bacterium]